MPPENGRAPLPPGGGGSRNKKRRKVKQKRLTRATPALHPLAAPKEALAFLARLDPKADGFTFLTFDDRGKDGKLTRVLHGPLAEHAADLGTLKLAGRRDLRHDQRDQRQGAEGGKHYPRPRRVRRPGWRTPRPRQVL